MSEINKNINPSGVNSATSDVENIMRKYDKESNTRLWDGKPALIVRIIKVLFSLYCICSTLFSTASLEIRLCTFIGAIIIIGFLQYPASKHHVRTNYIPWYDFILMVIGAACFFWYALSYNKLILVLTSASKMTPTYVAIAVIGILILMELCRRCVGLPILCVAAAILIYTFAIGTKFRRLLYTLFFSTSGVLNTPIQVCAKYIVVFIIFGAFLERTGISEFFISLANALVGKFSGGPAKVAVISSALCGMVSGSSVGNTVTTGSVTIPMMKETGYKPEFAGAVEASASTGGQIMPPIMGAAAFLMAEYMDVTYATVALKAILPAVLYFLGIFISVHLEAKKLGLKGIEPERLPKIKKLIKKIYLLLPLVLLVWMVTKGVRTMQTAATLAIFATIIVNLFDKDNRITFNKIFEALEAGGNSTITVAVACCMAGIISGCITATGLASKLIAAVVAISSKVPVIAGIDLKIFVALFLTMICCIILGMGVPTTANYCIMASTCAPILIAIGIPKVAAHFFVFYFGIVADITPPVALAAYAGSAIAKSDPMKTGVQATKLAIAAFIVPYVFAMNPAMLFVDTTAFDVVSIIITSVIGLFCVSMALEGYFMTKIPGLLRVISVIGGLALIVPGLVSDLIGLCVLVVIFAQQIISKKKVKDLPAN
ncbi:MAG: TRAP transporter permease [Bacillota bacterium]|nr:TRAP transporter permease [Bacillota bacterium]